MTSEPILIDDNVVVTCPVADVGRLLGDHSMIAAWFSATVESTSTTISAAGQRLVVEDIRERWMPNDQMLTVDGLLGGVRLHAHLTVFGVGVSVTGAQVDAATEIWVHVELSNGPDAQQIATVVRAVIRLGLERLSAELGGAPRPRS